MEMKPLVIGDIEAKIPIIQGGMGVGISLSSLAAAVAKEGGIGVISTAQIGYQYEGYAKNPTATNLKAIGEEIKKARKIAEGGVIAVNIMVATRGYEEYVKAAVNAGVDLIISGAGLPVTLPALVGDATTKMAPIVSSLKSAQVICKYWWKKYERLPDLVVIEGPKAGGHLGFSMEQLQDEVYLEHYEDEILAIISYIKELSAEKDKKIPVVIAGGIYDKEDIKHALSLGADGVQIATRFVTTYECDASIEYKQTYIDAQKEDIVLVKSPVGMPGRAILNPFMKRVEKEKVPHAKCHGCIISCNPMETPYCITEALVNAAKGNTDEALLFCGTNAYRATKIEHVSDIFKELRF